MNNFHLVVSSLARFLGLSGSYPRPIVTSYAILCNGITLNNALMYPDLGTVNTLPLLTYSNNPRVALSLMSVIITAVTLTLLTTFFIIVINFSFYSSSSIMNIVGVIGFNTTKL
jgi:hypothetical protein